MTTPTPSTSTESERNEDTARRYFDALGARSDDSMLRTFFHEQVEQVEYPNRLVPGGAKRNLADLLAASERGRQVVESERYVVKKLLAVGHCVAAELEWSATLKVPIATLAAGSVMRAHFAVFLEFADGLIVSQHNYDCFEPF